MPKFKLSGVDMRNPDGTAIEERHYVQIARATTGFAVTSPPTTGRHPDPVWYGLWTYRHHEPLAKTPPDGFDTPTNALRQAARLFLKATEPTT